MFGFEQTDLKIPFIEILPEPVELTVRLLSDGRYLCVRGTLELIDLCVESLDQCIPSLRGDTELLLKHVEEKTVTIVLVEGTPNLTRLLADDSKFLHDLLGGHFYKFDTDITIFL